MFHEMQPYNNLEQRRRLQKQRLRHRLQLQSRQIESVLAENRLPAQVSGGRVVPEAVQFDLQTQVNSSMEWLRSLTQDLRQALGVPHIQITRDNGRLQVAVARQVEVPVRLLDVMAMGIDIPPETAVVGLSEQGEPVLLPMPNNHVLIAGAEGAGKTSLLRSIAMSLALTNRQSRLQQIMVAPIFYNNKPFTDLEPLTILPHLSANIAYRTDDAINHISWLVEEMEYRLRWGERSPSIILMIDQVVQLLEDGGDLLMDAVINLLQHGNKAGIRLILTTSNPDSPLLNSYIRANLPVRLVGQVADSKQAASASGLTNSDAENLLGSGDFLFVENGRQVYFQAAYIGDYDLHLSLKKLQKKLRYSIRARPYSVRPHLSAEVDSPVQTSFWMDNGSAYFYDEEE